MTVAHYVLLGRTAHLGAPGRESGQRPRRRRRTRSTSSTCSVSPTAVGHAVGRRTPARRAARGLAQQAPLLFLDEPTAALDIGHQQDLLELIDDLRRELGLTIVSTMHDLTLTAQYGDHLILMDRGRVAHLRTARPSAHQRTAAAGTTAPASTSSATTATSSSCRGATTTSEEPDMTTRDPDGHPHRRPAPRRPRPAPSLVLVNTGNGKGKTSAAIGVVVRGVGRGWPVAVVQFLKSGTWRTGEEKVCRQLGVDWWAMGDGLHLGLRPTSPKTKRSPRRRGSTAVALDRRRRPPARRARRDHLPDQLGMDRRDDVRRDDQRTTAARQHRVHRPQRARRAHRDRRHRHRDGQVVKHAYQQGIRAKKGIDY